MISTQDRQFIEGFFGDQRQSGGRLNSEHALETTMFIEQCSMKTGELDEETVRTLSRAGLGHDLLEDTDCTEERIVAVWGENVARIIRALTNRQGDSKMDGYIRTLADSDEGTLLVKFADIRSNVRNSVFEFEKLDRKWIAEFWIPLLFEYEKNLMRRKFEKYPKTADLMISEIKKHIEDLYRLVSTKPAGCAKDEGGEDRREKETPKSAHQESIRKPPAEKLISVLAYYAIPIVLLLQSSEYSDIVWYGKIAEVLLYATLFVKPVAMLVRWNVLLKILPYRRQMGVATFWFAFFHGANMLLAIGLQKPAWYFDPGSLIPYGILALLGLSVMAVTSNDRAVRYLGRNWKRVHYLAYPVFFLVLLHVSIAQKETLKFFILAFLYVALQYAVARRSRS